MTTLPGEPPSTPDDLELMLYADGELQGERLAAVEAWVARDGAARAKLKALGLVSSVVRERALDTHGDAGELADAVMDLIDREPVTGAAPAEPLRRRSRARGPSRGVYVIAAVTAMAAAAALLWSRAPAPSTEPVVHRTSPAPENTAPVLAAPTPPKFEADIDHGVEVAAVDFGSRTGAVFYVPTGSATSSTTTVVWLSDDSAGEDQ